MFGRIKECAFSILAFLAILCLSEALADEIVLKNGDRISGTVTEANSEFVTIATGYSDPIRVKKSEVSAITTDGSKDIHSTGGEIFRGKIRPLGDGRIAVERGEGGEGPVLDWESVAAINPPPEHPAGWKGSVLLGAGLQTGNTDRLNASFQGEATRRTGRDRFGLRLFFHYAEEDDEISERNTYGTLKYDYFFTRVMYGYLGVEMLNDKFKDLNLRTVVGPGIGYQVWEDKVKFLLFEAGLAYFSEDLKEGEDDDWVTARLAADVKYTMGRGIVFSNSLVIYPNLEDFGRYQLRNEAGLTTPLGTVWALRLINILERDSHPPQGVRKHDLQWILGIQRDF